jgi:hypothetical protein
MCTDFTNLNKYYPKDDFPLTRIYKNVDSATGCEIMALLIFSQAIIKSGSTKKMRRRQDSSLLLECTATSKCTKVCTM